MTDPQSYRVHMTYEVWVTVQAETPEEAQELVNDMSLTHVVTEETYFVSSAYGNETPEVEE